MERTLKAAHRRRLILFALLAGVAAFLLRDVIRALGMQVLAASVLMLLALPLCRQLEKRLPAGAAAALSLAALILVTLALLLALIPPAARQMQALAASLPALLETLRGLLSRASGWLTGRGIDLTALRDGLFTQGSGAAGNLVTRAMGIATGIVGSLSKVFLSPLMAFYLLRDRRKITVWLTLLLPVDSRARGVRAAREMKRETAAFLRGQLLLSLVVGGLTALALLLTGTPAWLLLGVLMGVMELVPYIGPVLAGIPAVLLALQGGVISALWTLGVLVAVQQIEGGMLSPRLLSGATRLHPLLVLMAISAGGILAGPVGMVLALPVVVSVRGALRGFRV